MAFSFRAGTNWCHDFPKLARESGFHFNMHRTQVRVDWNRISSIDIDRVIGERDFLTIDENINNVVDYCLESEKILDPNFVKLFRLAQLAVEYLLYCKQYLDRSVIILKDELRAKLEDNAKLRKERDARDDAAKEIKEKSRIVETKLSGDSHGEIHKCPHCPKTFISAVFANAHVNRRHPRVSPVHEQYRAEAEKLHDEIKTLKERLNLTERLIRNASDSLVSNCIDKSDQRNIRDDQDDRIEEHHRRYHEEIKNFKAALFNELRNLNVNSERYSWGKSETSGDDNNVSVKELIRQQENEIQRLRDRLNKRLTPDIEGIQAKLDNQESFWQSKIDLIENRHRMDMEKLYTQLRVTQESSNQMRIDYTTKINDLERRSSRHAEAALSNEALTDESTRNSVDDVAPKEIAKKKVTSPKKTLQRRMANPKESPANKVVNYKERNRENKKTRASEEQKNIHGTLTNGFATTSRSSESRGLEKKRESSADSSDASRGSSKQVVEMPSPSPSPSPSHHFARDVSKIEETRLLMERNGREKPNAKSERSDSQMSSESRSQSESENSVEKQHADTDFDSVETENSEYSRDSRDEHNSSNHRPSWREKVGSVDKYQRAVEESKKTSLEQFETRLRDLGIDPEWRGIPNATFRQIMQTLIHQQSLNSKKYENFDEIRSRLIEQIAAQKLSPDKKETTARVDGSRKSSPIDKFMTTVKSKAIKALSMMEQKSEGKREKLIVTRRKLSGSHGVNKPPSATDSLARPSKVQLRKFSAENNVSSAKMMKNQDERNIVKCKVSPREQARTKRAVPRLPGEQATYQRYSALVAPRATSNTTIRDIKHFSHSYESIKDFTNERVGPVASGVLVASTPQRNDDPPSSSFSNDRSAVVGAALNISSSPKNNSKSLLKTSSGSVGSLVKKKVLFDLNDQEEKEASSRYDEGDETVGAAEEIESPQFGGNIVLKISQSEKIAKISKEIEKQLSTARRKPVGAVEAMFVEKFTPKRDENETRLTDTPTPREFRSKFNGTDVPAPRSFNAHSTSGLANRAQLDDSDSKDSILDMDIDELLRIE